MAFPLYVKQDLADFSGRILASYGGYADTAIAQSTLLFKIGTCLADFPQELTEASLAKMGILAMADAVFLNQPYQQQLASPFSTEHIGSYSYSKAVKAVTVGLDTGIMWFDLAISRLSQCPVNDGIPMGGGIEVFESTGMLMAGAHDNFRFLGPEDIRKSQMFGFDPSPYSTEVPVALIEPDYLHPGH